MKVYSCPDECKEPVVNYNNFDYNKYVEDENNHTRRLKEWLIKEGFTGKYTGEIYRESIADGYALYMMADGPKSFLIHLKYGDGYSSRNVQFIPKKEIIKRINADKKFSEMFNETRKAQTI